MGHWFWISNHCVCWVHGSKTLCRGSWVNWDPTSLPCSTTTLRQPLSSTDWPSPSAPTSCLSSVWKRSGTYLMMSVVCRLSRNAQVLIWWCLCLFFVWKCSSTYLMMSVIHLESLRYLSNHILSSTWKHSGTYLFTCIPSSVLKHFGTYLIAPCLSAFWKQILSIM